MWRDNSKKHRGDPEALGPPRDPDSDEYMGKWADLAASAQATYEDIFFHVLGHLQEVSGKTRLCLAGGCALNSVANGKILGRTRFREVFVQPAAADNGTSIGAGIPTWVAQLVLLKVTPGIQHRSSPGFGGGGVDLGAEV